MIATGFAGGPTGTRIIEQLTDEAILNDFVRIHEESRTSTAVVDPASGEQTEINEHGPEITDAELDLFRDKLLYLAKGAGVCVFCGSLPRGAPASLYAELVQELRKVGVTTVLDSDGEALDLATRAEPTVVTPNELEAEELVGHEFADDQDRLTAVSEIVELGAHEAVMTMETGCVALVEETGPGQPDSGKLLYRCRLEPQDTPVSRVGSGDAFLAGYVASRYGGGASEEGLRFAVACGAESTQHFGAGVLDGKAVERLAADVEVERLPEPALEARGIAASAAQNASGAGPARRSGEALDLDSVYPPPNLGCRHGSRDRSGQEGASRLRVR